MKKAKNSLVIILVVCIVVLSVALLLWDNKSDQQSTDATDALEAPEKDSVNTVRVENEELIGEETYKFELHNLGSDTVVCSVDVVVTQNSTELTRDTYEAGEIAPDGVTVLQKQVVLPYGRAVIEAFPDCR